MKAFFLLFDGTAQNNAELFSSIGFFSIIFALGNFDCPGSLYRTIDENNELNGVVRHVQTVEFRPLDYHNFVSEN